jgi:hypothetical protein
LAAQHHQVDVCNETCRVTKYRQSVLDPSDGLQLQPPDTSQEAKFVLQVNSIPQIGQKNFTVEHEDTQTLRLQPEEILSSVLFPL